MKKLLCFFTIIFLGNIALGQTVYYWVGGTASTAGINSSTNWNTMQDGSGTGRSTSSNTTDILIYDGTNVGGATPATGPVNVLANSGISFAQMHFRNNVTVSWQRTSTGTSTMSINGAPGADFTIEAGSSFICNSTVGSLRLSMLGSTDSAVISGTCRLTQNQQVRFENIAAPNCVMIFKSGSSFTTNITNTTYAFGNSAQATENWVTFEDGSDLYYEGGSSPFGSSSTFSPVLFKPNSTFHLRSPNAGNLGSFFNRRSLGNLSIENAAVLTADGSLYRINNLTINAGASMITHTTGQTVINGNMIINGSLTGDPTGTNELVMSGSATQTISGTGTINVPRFVVSAGSDVVLSKNAIISGLATVYGKINFSTNQLTGAGDFKAITPIAAIAATGNTISGSYIITGNMILQATDRGKLISGAGIPAGTNIIYISSTLDSVYISKAMTATANAVALSVSTAGASLSTANTNGFDPLTGSVILAGNLSYQDNINYTIDTATVSPFGISTGSTDNLNLANVTINAAATSNASALVNNVFTVNGIYTIRPADTLHLLASGSLAGTFGSTKYISTAYNTGTGTHGILLKDGISVATVLPIGTPTYYLPVTVTPTTTSDFSARVFEGITLNGQLQGTPFTAAQKQLVVNAVWNVNRTAGAGDAEVKLTWVPQLEGSTFGTLPDTSIGLIRNTGTAFAPPIGTGSNSTNTAMATLSTFGALSAGAKAPTNPFTFNAIPTKTYGAADFNGGATSLNQVNPIVYTSSDPAVATIIGNDIHITGAGTSQITASQDGDGGLYDTVAITRTLTVNKAALTIKADQKSKFEQTANPTLTATYTGFVLGETPANLLTPATLSTTAVTASAPGNYPITVAGATSNNYAISFVNDTLKVIAKTNQTITFAAIPAKIYGNADFSAGATSTNATTPLTYNSSNTSVATISSTGIISITGAGTTTITVSQAGSAGFFPATDVVRTLIVSKAPLIIGVRDTSRLFGQQNPAFTLTYIGFVLNETAANLATQPQVTTSANVNSIPGIYTITPGDAVSQNYSITYTAGRLTILPATDPALQQLYVYHTGGGNIQVRIYSAKAELGDILIYDMNGRLLARRNIFMPVGFATTNISIPTIQSGSYSVAVRGVSGGVVQLQTIFQLIR